MDFLETVNTAFEALLLNKTRTGLATLGIIIGIASVITLLSLGQSGQKAVESQIQSLGSNLLTIVPGALRPGDFRSASGTSNTLTWADAKAIQGSRIPGIKNVSAELLRRTTVTSGKNSTNTQIVGVVPTYKEVRKLEMQYGNFFMQRDVDTYAKLAVIGPQVVSDLFGEGVNPVGKTIRIDKLSLKVIGGLVAKGGSGFSNLDDVVLVPLSTAQKQLFGVDYIGSVSIEVTAPELSETVRGDIGYFLLARHKITDAANADFTIFSQADILGAAAQVTSIFTTLLSGIAAISLLVGGIGIMNIMLVNVVERTREIGLRKALGATKKTIVTQFLIESIMVTFVGGILGMILGISLSFIISYFINLPFILLLSSILLALFVSCGIGILFGWYPARKAANLSPIEALRYE